MRKRAHKDILYRQPVSEGAARLREERAEYRPEALQEDGEQKPAGAISAPDTLQQNATEAQLEETIKQYLCVLAANTPDAVIALNANFQVVAFNPAATATLGWRPETTYGRSCMEMLKCRNLNGTELCGTSSCPLVRVLQHKRALPNEEIMIGANPNTACEVSVSVTPVDIGSGMHVVFTARDVSALKIANRVRANFVSMVSHELRTPLNSVHGFIDLLMLGHMGQLTEEQLKYLGYAQEGVQQLISIVEDILFMTRSDSGQFDMQPQKVNFRALAKQVVTSLQPQALKAEVLIDKDIPTPAPLLYADPKRIKQVLNNLVTNAIKFTPPGGTVTISVSTYDEQWALVSVNDNGFGISSTDREHVFERFYQSNHSLQSKMGGYGLGLTIARLIVEQHEGRIWFDTVPGEGTTFHFTVALYTGQLESDE